MSIKASKRSALIIAAGLWICAAGPLRAAESDGEASPPQSSEQAAVGSATGVEAVPGKGGKRHASRKSTRSGKSDRLARKDAKSTRAKDIIKDTPDEAAQADTAAAPAASTGMPPAVANANAHWPVDSTTTSTIGAATAAAQAVVGPALMSGMPEQPATAVSEPAGNAQVVAADQLNDLDRALGENKPPLTLARATIDSPEVASNSESTWDKTSLIGKVFIAFGGLLTMASAARMFMA